MKLTQLLRDQRQELEEGLKDKRIINREAEDNYKKTLTSKLIKVVSGVRRCGKSVFTHTLLMDKKFAYMNFDDDRLTNFDSNQILSSFYEIHGKNLEFIFLDEIQNMEKWELFANRLHRAGFNIFLTGSNAKLLSRELATHLTGRHLTIELYPFSFREYLTANDFGEDPQTTRGVSILKHELRDYLTGGGFPEIIVEKENPKIYLRELCSKIIERDIVGRYNLSYKKTFKEIAYSLLSSPGRSISYNKLKKQFNLGSEHTVKNYVSYLEEAYLVFLVNRFSFKPVEVEKSSKKVYAIDTGLTNNLSIKFTEDIGHAYENAVALELLRRKSYIPGLEIYYWKNSRQEEVDFIVKEGLKVKQLIQVCYDIDGVDTRKRETRSLLQASKNLKCRDLLVITGDYEREEEASWYGTQRKIKYVPLWKWLLGK